LFLFLAVAKVAKLLGPDWCRAVTRAFWVAFVGFFAFLVCAFAYQAASPVVTLGSGTAPPASNQQTPQDFTKLWATFATFALGALVVLKGAGQSVLAEWAKRRLDKPKASSRAVALYDGSGRVVRQVVIEAAD
jgi:hypothetical protein